MLWEPVVHNVHVYTYVLNIFSTLFHNQIQADTKTLAEDRDNFKLLYEQVCTRSVSLLVQFLLSQSPSHFCHSTGKAKQEIDPWEQCPALGSIPSFPVLCLAFVTVRGAMLVQHHTCLLAIYLLFFFLSTQLPGE